MELTDNLKRGIAAGLVALLLAVLGLFAGRSYERHTVNQEYQETLKQKDEQIRKTSESLATVMIERGQAYAKLEQLKRQARSWDRGDEYTDAAGVVHKVWDRGEESSEEVVDSLLSQLQESNISLQKMSEKEYLARTESDSLRVQLLKAETLIKKPGDVRAILVNWDMEGKTWHTALNTQLVIGLGTFLGSVSLRPGGPFRPGNEGKEVLQRVFDLGPSVGLGLRF